MISKDELEELGIFKDVNKHSLNEICENGEIRCYLKGKHIFRDKENIDDIYIVHKGKAALYKINEYGQKKVIFILGKGSFLNEVILDYLSSSINCEAFENCEIISIKKAKFMEIMEDDFKLTTLVINSLAKKTRRMYRQLKNSTSLKIEKKLAAKLWKLSKDYGKTVEEGTLIDLALSVTYLSEMFGIPRETISRALKILVKEGLIIQRNKRIIVVDKEKLSKYFKGL